MTKNYLLALFTLLCFAAHGQQCEWLQVSKGYHDQALYTTVIDKNNDIISVGDYNDSFTLGSFYVSHPFNNGSHQALMVKYNDAGQLQWTKQVNTNTIALSNQCGFTSVATDDQANIYATLVFNGPVTVGSNSFSNANSIILIKYNSAGVLQWLRPFLSLTTASNGPSAVVSIDRSQNITVGFSHSAYMSCPGAPSSIPSLGLNTLSIIKYTPAGNYVASATFGGGDDNIFALGSDNDNNIYAYINSRSNFSFGSKYYPAALGILILKMDSLFTPINSLKVSNGTGLGPGIRGMKVNDDGHLIVGYMFKGTTDFGGISLTASGGGISSGNTAIVYYDSTLKPLWAQKDNPVTTGELFLYGVCMRHNYIYFSGLLQRSTVFGSTSVNFIPTNGNLLIGKMDTLGNFLWVFNSSGGSGSGANTWGYDISVDSFDNAVLTGGYLKEVTVFNRKDSGAQSNDFFLAMIADYGISRGYVSPGPYCAGDSISIPYDKKGNFKPGNQFIAQLSDSAGNFTGNERELGRITDTAAGVIKGTLPLFNVASNSRYRIRVISTEPVVQSFYKLDTLRLLIYSRDTANAGPDQTICRGQSIQLGTTGGTRWSWSPPTGFINMQDTANRQPLVKPLTSTQYRIIIGDSSGCGLTDTDYVNITVRAALKISLPDTITVCKGHPYTLAPKVSGGDSSKYSYLINPYGSSSFTTGLEVNTLVKGRYIVTLTDSCSEPAKDTLWIVPDSGLVLQHIPDTLICSGNTLVVSARATTCDTTSVKYVWNNGLGEGQTKLLSPLANTLYKIMAYDTINGAVDSVQFWVNVRPPLQLALNNDTTLCHGNTIQLKATATGGKSSTYKIDWTADNSNWTDTGFVINIQPDTTTTYIAIFTDNCTPGADTATIKVTVRSALKIQVNADTTICVGESAELRAVASGGLPANYTINWKADNSLWTANSFATIVTPTVTTTYTARLSDNCSQPDDSARITVTVRLPLNISVNKDTTICHTGSVNLIASPTGGLPAGYRILWKENNSAWTDTVFSLSVLPAQSIVYTALLTDNCTSPADSAKVSVTVLPPLSVKASAKDSICRGQSITLNAALAGGKASAYNFRWSAIPVGFSSTQNPVTDTPQVSTTYIATLSDNCSAGAGDTITVIVLPRPVANFKIDPTEGCPPLRVTLTDASADNDSVKNIWHVLAYEATGIKNFSYEFLYPGTYSIGLTVANTLGCMDAATRPAAVTVYEKPQAAFAIKPDIIETEKEVFFFNTSQKSTQFLWDFGDGNTLLQFAKNDTLHSYADSGTYTVLLVGENEKGCKDTALQSIRVHEHQTCLVPNAFTPGTPDNLNPVFMPVCNGVRDYTLTLYNRWGQVIQHCQNCGWDGTYMDTPVEAGPYLYQLQLTAWSGKKETLFGLVNVLR